MTEYTEERNDFQNSRSKYSDPTRGCYPGSSWNTWNTGKPLDKADLSESTLAAFPGGSVLCSFNSIVLT
jgi:hypothetical protein